MGARDKEEAKRGVERAVQECYATWGETYFDEYYGDDAPYPPVHRDLVRRLVLDSGAKTLLDAGCGPASILRAFADTGVEPYGFDLTPEMTEEARRVMAGLGVPPDRIWTGSVTDAAAFRPPIGDAPEAFDAAICIGVLPHIPEAEEDTVIDNLRRSVRPGGLVVLEARNALFSLFTLNRYSWSFFADELIGFDRLEASGAIAPETLAALREELAQRFRMDLPPVRKGKIGEPGYDEILSRSHNPFVLARRLSDAGFKEVRTLFYHYHRLPPMTEGRLGQSFRRLGLEMEDPEDWRGHFMASAFLAAGVRVR